MSGPMDPKRLASLRANIDAGAVGRRFLAYVSELLVSNDHHGKRADAAEAKLEVALTGGLRGLLDDAEAERDKYRAKLIGLMGSEGFEAFDNGVPF